MAYTFAAMRIIDTHSHLYLAEFKEDLYLVVDRARKQGVEKIFLPNVDSSSSDDLLLLVQQYPDFCYPMMGLHPCSVKENYKEELQQIRQTLDANLNKIIAVGEIGIDLYWDKSTLPIQIEAFKIQIEWAFELHLPIVIHARESFDEIFEVLEEYRNRGLRGVFHCFTGNLAQGQWIADFGFYMGIGGVITYKKSDLKDFVSQLPADRLLLETDAPYLSPVPYRGKRNEPSYLPYVVEVLAQALGKSSTDTAELCSNNALNLFRIAQ